MFGSERKIYMLTKDVLGGAQIHGCDACACVRCELKHFPESSEIDSPFELIASSFSLALSYIQGPKDPTQMRNPTFSTLHAYFLCGISGDCERIL